MPTSSNTVNCFCNVVVLSIKYSLLVARVIVRLRIKVSFVLRVVYYALTVSLESRLY